MRKEWQEWMFAYELARKVGCPPRKDLLWHVRRLLKAETAKDWLEMRRIPDLAVCCAYLLFLNGDPEDSLLVFEARMTRRDMYLAVDAELAFGAGVQQTVRFIRDEAMKYPDLEEYLQEIEELHSEGRLTRFDREYWVELYRDRFFRPRSSLDPDF